MDVAVGRSVEILETEREGGSVEHDAVADDGVRQFVIGVLTQVSKRWEVGWHETTTITTAV